jgi:hypothetical protein
MAKNKRIPIPKEIERELLVECSHKCSVPFCLETHDLEFHHINGDPSDNKKSNIIVFCPNHHTMADRGKIDRKECAAYKERLKQMVSLQPTNETLKQKVEREGIDVPPENPFVKLILYLGRGYMNWRYGKPNASINREITVLLVLIILCFVPLAYTFYAASQGAALSTPFLYLLVFSLVAGSVLISGFSVIHKRRCPKCRGYFGIERIVSKKVDEKKHRTQTEIKIEKIYRNTYRCVFCGHSYTMNESEYETIPIARES